MIKTAVDTAIVEQLSFPRGEGGTSVPPAVIK